MIDAIKNNVSILDLLSYLGIPVNKSDFINSIYKDEKTPSLKIYPHSNTFFCFATNQGGDVIKFYCDYFKLDTKDAVKELAEKFNISKRNGYLAACNNKKEIETEYFLLDAEKELFNYHLNIFQHEKKINRNEALNLAFNEIKRNRILIQSKIFNAIYNFSISKGFDEKVYLYLTGKDRGLNEAGIKEFKLFNIYSVNEIIEFLKDNFPRYELKLSGLFSKKYFVFTKHRIIIPYIENSQIVYLRGRYFFNGNSKPEKFGKYIGLNNWSETLSPKRFYNFDILKRLAPFSDLVITEGEFDAIISNQFGINSIGVSGVSNFPAHQIELLNHFNIYLAFDSDLAGIKAIEKISALFNKPIKIIKLKVHKDLSELYNNEKK